MRIAKFTHGVAIMENCFWPSGLIHIWRTPRKDLIRELLTPAVYYKVDIEGVHTSAMHRPGAVAGDCRIALGNFYGYVDLFECLVLMEKKNQKF